MAIDKRLPLLGGIIAGATLGVAAAFLFGTEEGKKVRRDLRNKLPGVFTTVDDMVQNSKGLLQDLPASLLDDVKLLISEATAPQTRPTDVQEGKILPPQIETIPLKKARVVASSKKTK